MSLRKSQPILYCSHERNILPLTTEMKKKSTSQETSITRSSAVEYLTFIAGKGEGGVEAIYEDEDIWLSQKMMAALYNVDVRTINYHLQKIFKERELEENSVIRKFRITATDGKSYHTGHYNLSATIAVGYKVNSERAVQFRKWATTIVKEYTVKGFAMDNERLKAGGTILTEQYFEEQLQRVREIRLSERKFYQKITDIYATAIETGAPPPPNASSPPCKTSSTGRFTGKPLPKSFIPVQMQRKQIWVSPHGKIRPKERSRSSMLASPRTTSLIQRYSNFPVW